MARLLNAKVSPNNLDRTASWMAGVGMMAAVTALCVAALPDLPSATGFVLGIGVGAGWAVMAWASPGVFVRR